MSRVLGVIPARLESTRLPRKPLQMVAGAPLIAWVWSRAQSIPVLDRVVVATDSPEIQAVCEDYGAETVLTAVEHPSGTDRVHEAVSVLQPDADIVVNIQGDEPLVDPTHVEAAVELVSTGWDMGTVAYPLFSQSKFKEPSTVKVVRSSDGGALYFSRAPIPHLRDSTDIPDAGNVQAPRTEPWGLGHVGLYAYSKSALARVVSLKPSRLEKIERLEQLRALENGIRIGVAVVGEGAPGVDTPADVKHVEDIIQARGLEVPRLLSS